MFERNQLISYNTINPVEYANHHDSMLNYDVQSFLIENKEAILSFLQNVERPRFPVGMIELNSMSKSPSPITRGRSGSRSKSLSRSPRDRRYSRSRSASPRRSRSRSRSRSTSRSPRRYSSSKYSPKRRYRSRSRSPRDHRRSDYSGRSSRRFGDGREKPKPCRCIGVFGMSLDTSERNLQKLFEKYGKIDNIKIIRDHYSGRSRGYGFIYYDDIRDAEDAKQAMTDAVIDGAKVRVDFSVTDGPSRGKRARSRSPVYRRSRSRS